MNAEEKKQLEAFAMAAKAQHWADQWLAYAVELSDGGVSTQDEGSLPPPPPPPKHT